MGFPRARAAVGAQLRFSELAYLIGGVSEKMLAQTLRRLEMDGFVRREVHATKPPKLSTACHPLAAK